MCLLDLATARVSRLCMGSEPGKSTELDEHYHSTSRSIFPIVKIDECIIGSGKTGTITQISSDINNLLKWN